MKKAPSITPPDGIDTGMCQVIRLPGHRLTPQTDTPPDLRQDMFEPCGVLLDLLPQVADVHA